MIGRTLGRYRVLDRVEGRRPGRAYRARDERLEREVILVLLPPDPARDEQDRLRVRMAVRRLAQLDHPSIPKVLDFDTREGVDFFVTEHVDGVPLAEKLGGGRAAEALTAEIARQLLDGLAAAHARGIVHGALAPGRLLLTPDLQLKLPELGIDLLLPGGTRARDAELAGYVAPEVAAGGPATARSDIWSAGAVIHAMATGEPPATPDAERDAQGRWSQRRAPELSPAMAGFLLSCLVEDPARRFESSEIARDSLPEADNTHATTEETSSFRRPRLAHALLAGVLIAALPFAIVLCDLDRPFVLPPEEDRIDSIAVLPFESLSGPDQQFLGDGISAELIMRLSQIRGLKVPSMTSVMRYRGTRMRVPQIAEELGVDAVIEGAAIRSDEGIRVSVRFVDAAKDSGMWSRTYDRGPGDLLQLQSEVATDIVRQVRVEATPDERYRIQRAQQVDPAAYEAYLRGRDLLERREPDGLQAGIRYLKQAVEIDPGYAPAHAGLANGYALLASTGYDVLEPRVAMPMAKTEAEAAVALGGDLAEAHTALAQILHNYEWNWTAAEQSFRRALELNPGFATARQWYAFHLAARSRLDESLDLMSSALDLDPLSPLAWTSAGRIHYYRGEHDRAISHFERALTIDRLFLPAHILLGLAHVAHGEHVEAIHTFERGRELFEGAPALLAGLGVAYAAAGEDEDARGVLRRLEGIREERYVPAIYEAAVLTRLGQTDRAIERLERALEERVEAMTYLAVEPIFSSLHGDPAFGTLLERMGLDTEATGVP